MTSLSIHPGKRGFILLTLVLLSHIVPTLIIGFGFVIPGSCIAGINEHTLGFISSLVGFAITFWFGVYLARKLALEDAAKAAARGT